MRSIPNTYMSISKAFHTPTNNPLVIEDLKQKKLVAHGSLLVELKLARNLSMAAHIEDVVVDSSTRGKGFGKM